MEYLGSLGRLVPLRCSSREQLQRQPRYVEEFTVEGHRRVQVLPASPRAWDVQWELGRPGQVAALAEFVSGAWGRGPWHWVPIQAQSGNLLTPREAVLLDRFGHSSLSDAGPVRASDGAWSPRSVSVDLASGWVFMTARNLPVLPGVPVTWAADVEGAGPQIQLTFYDDADTQMSAHLSSAGGPGLSRVSVTAVAPSRAVYARIGVRSTVTRVTRPQVTWTSSPVPWSAGHGCPSAVVDGLAEDLLAASRHGTYSNVGFTVMEVS